MTHRTRLLFPLLAAALTAATPLPVDPQVRIGTLPNGLKYYVRANARPEKRAELRLVVNAGEKDGVGPQFLVHNSADTVGVIVVEDVITTGGSALRAIEAVRAANGTVIGVLAVVDREEGGRAAIEAAGVPVIALATAAEVLSKTA